jgi:phosphoribosylamine--glycine ligase
MQRHAIPTAAYKVFDDAAAAHAHIDDARTPIVVKADGLAAGKGVVVAATRSEAHAAIEAMLGGAAPAGSRVVIEEFLDGEEASFIVVCDGSRVLPLATSQDHKRIGDADTGANTGGMGAYSPAPVVTPNVHQRALHEIVLPTIAGMAAEGRPFVGFLYAGLMIDEHGTPKTVEFNCRLGDPRRR